MFVFNAQAKPSAFPANGYVMVIPIALTEPMKTRRHCTVRKRKRAPANNSPVETAVVFIKIGPAIMIMIVATEVTKAQIVTAGTGLAAPTSFLVKTPNALRKHTAAIKIMTAATIRTNGTVQLLPPLLVRKDNLLVTTVNVSTRL